MPQIRYTYPKDIAVHGDRPLDVDPVTAHVLVVERRRAVYECTRPCAAFCPQPDLADCADCPVVADPAPEPES